jgi:hypothetical protein
VFLCDEEDEPDCGSAAWLRMGRAKCLIIHISSAATSKKLWKFRLRFFEV